MRNAVASKTNGVATGTVSSHVYMTSNISTVEARLEGVVNWINTSQWLNGVPDNRFIGRAIAKDVLIFRQGIEVVLVLVRPSYPPIHYWL